jgi:ABC-2 type transport system permease protein
VSSTTHSAVKPGPSGSSLAKCLLIARRELGSFFNTWMGYVIAAAVLFVNGLLFNAFAVGQQPKFSADVLADFFYFASGMSMVSGIFLAMRLMAEEKQSGTIVLFYTSPVTERQLIYGKFLSAFAFALVLHALSLYLPALIFIHGKISLGHLAAGYLCLVLIGASTMAITLFASTISPNQLVSAVMGAFVTVTLLVLWMVADIVEPPFKELFGWMSIHNKHFTPFSRGIVRISDVVYYLSVIVFFLECSVRALEARRWRG